MHYKKQKESVSYGMVVWCSSTNKFLIYQQRDTYAYSEFIRGLWTSQCELYDLFMLMTRAERERIRTHSFDELWSDFWVSKDMYIFKHGKERSTRQFDDVINEINYIISFANDQECSTDLQWGFPKGKPDKNESAEDCAFRELKEEMGWLHYSNTELGINIVNCGPVCETYTSSDGKVYTCYYFIGVCNDEIQIRTHPPTKDSIRKERFVSNEASDAVWADETLALKKINIRKRKILQQTKKILRLV